jgi:hypothetical protein
MKLSAPLVGWFHLGSDEASSAREFLRLCNGEDAVDELGFGILRDGFSDDFFPGTSTVMTETRYLVFVAAICRSMERALERKNAAIADPYRRSRDMQDQLRDVLSETFKNKLGHGVIGISVMQPERYPSAIYWASLRTLGILRWRGGGERDYLRALLRHSDLFRTDDNYGDPVAEIVPPSIHWDRRFPYFEDATAIMDDKGHFRDGLNFDLTRREARYLQDCYLGADGGTPPTNGIHKSLLAHQIRTKSKVSFQYPWDLSPPPDLEATVDDARRFSILARGATLQYYDCLIEQRNTEGWQVPDADIRGWFRTWWEEGRPQLMEWDLAGFIQRRARYLRASRNDITFLQEWLRHCSTSKSASYFLAKSEVRQLIVQRERVCKPSKARLTHKKHLQSWNRQLPDLQTPYQLAFRADIANVFVQRVVTGLKSSAQGGKWDAE